MDKGKVQSVQEKINKYISELQAQDKYNNLEITVLIALSAEETNINSNAFIGIKNSLSANTKIINYFYSIIEDGDNYDVEIKFKENNIVLDENLVPSNIASKYIPEVPKHKLCDVILPDNAKKDLERAISMLCNFEKIYGEWNFIEKEPSAKTILCFYGEPGTGKTKCAHGVAQFLGKKIICASYADIQSEYVGVGPKNLKEIFHEAESNDAVLFFDEADSFLRRRTTDTRDAAAMHYNSMTNEMMKHLEDFNGIVIFATNFTVNTDEAFKTRITASVEFPIPDLQTRSIIIKNMIPDKLPMLETLSDEDYKIIAETCDGFVGRDIRNAVKAVLFDGALKNTTAFSVKDFIDGFVEYKQNKEKLENNISGGSSNISVYDEIERSSANRYVMALCSYVAWYDGTESEEETVVLKKIAKLLYRDKPVITKLSDLPSLEELCDRITIKEQQVETIQYVADVLSVSNNDEQNIDLILKICGLFNLDNNIKESIKGIYEINKQRNHYAMLMK